MTLAEMLDKLVIPRENGSAALDEIATWIEKTARTTGADVAVHEFTCRPYVYSIAALVVFALGAGFFLAVWRRRTAVAVACAVAIPLYLFLEVEFFVPLLSWIGAGTQRNVVLSFPVTDATQTIILGAHYDTATYLFSDQARETTEFLFAPIVIVLGGLVFSVWRRRDEIPSPGQLGMAGAIAVYCATLSLAFGGGAFVSERSPGALDDAASVAMLLKVANELGEQPRLEHSNVRIVFFSGSEVDTQGSRAYVRELQASEPELPVVFVNAEALGYGPHLRVFASERFWLRRYDASTAVVRPIDRAAREVNRGGISSDRTPALTNPVVTDARSFMAAGIPSVCLTSSRLNDEIAPGLHSAADARNRVDVPALERDVRTYLAAIQQLDHDAPIR